MGKDIMNRIAASGEADACLICEDARCTAACPKGQDPARVIRALRFANSFGAAEYAEGANACLSCEGAPCIAACVRASLDRPIRIPELMKYAASGPVRAPDRKADLSVTFCGVPCENPFFLSSSIVAGHYDMIARAFAMGWAGACFKTIGTFVPEEVSPRFAAMPGEGRPIDGFKNIEQISDRLLEENLADIARLKKEYPTKIIIASILGQDEAEWTDLAEKVTAAGADIIECNFSCPHMTGDGLGSDVGQNPEMVARYTAAVRLGTTLPVLAKMTPNIGNMEIPALAAMRSGATGIAAINTIKSIMNIAPEDFVSAPDVDGKSCVGGYSGRAIKPIALRFIHDMKKHPELADVPISGMGGIENWRDALEFIALGCGTVQITTAVMEYGYRIIDDLLDGLSSYMEEHNIENVSSLLGGALPRLVSADSVDRKSRSYPVIRKEKCVGCGRCAVSCRDAGHQAIGWDASSGRPTLLIRNCVGCHLCLLVCPAKAIEAGKRVAPIV